MDPQLKKGLLDVCVLSVISRGETYGYKMLKDLEPYISVSESTLYPILRRLETNGYVVVHSVEHNGRLRKMYAITPEGMQDIKDFLEGWTQVEKIYGYIKEGVESE